MKHTANETHTTTLTRLIKALDRQHPVTISYLKEEKDANGKKTGQLVPTTRTIEIFNIVVTDAGHIVLRAMDRETKEMRSYRTDRLISYSIHRTAYLVPRPAPAAETKTRPTVGLASVVVLYPVDLPIAGRVQLLADALAA